MTMSFADTHHYKKNQLSKYKGKNFWPISPFGDGNCGLYAFACGLIDSILTGKLTLETEKFNELISCFQAFPSTYPKTINLNENIQSDISIFLEWIYQPNLTFSQFKDFFINYPLTRDSIIALNLSCSHALRIMGGVSYLDKIGMLEKPLLPEDEKIFETCVWVGEDILASLAGYFDIHIQLIVQNSPPASDYYDATLLPEGSTPTFALLLKNNHWHYLLPSEQTLGLAAILPCANNEDKKNPPKKTRRTSRDLLRSNEQLIQEVETIYAQKQTDFTAAATTLKRLFNKPKELFDSLKRIFNEKSEITILKRLSNHFKKIFDNFIEIFNQESKQTPTFKDAVTQAQTAAKKSTQTINLWREEWAVSNNQDENELDRNLDDLGLHYELEKTLIKEPLIMDDSNDPAVVFNSTVAAIVQNADIADFLSRNYTTLKKRTSSLSTNNGSAEIRDHNQSVMGHDQRIAALCISV